MADDQTTFAGEPAVLLGDGRAMPLLGLGVWQIPDGPAVEAAVAWALEVGYRHVDTAAAYGNEAGLGRAIRASGLPRDELFVTTKMRSSARDPARALGESLERLGLESVDLYLIHSPARRSELHWPAFAELRERGLARSVGVSNWDDGDIERLAATAELPPAVNQIDFSPFRFSAATVEAHLRAGVVLEAYSPLGRGRALANPLVAEIAAAHGRTPAQVLVRWAVQRGIPTIPKSSRRERIVENRGVFDFSLSSGDLARLDALGPG